MQGVSPLTGKLSCQLIKLSPRILPPNTEQLLTNEGLIPAPPVSPVLSSPPSCSCLCLRRSHYTASLQTDGERHSSGTLVEGKDSKRLPYNLCTFLCPLKSGSPPSTSRHCCGEADPMAASPPDPVDAMLPPTWTQHSMATVFPGSGCSMVTTVTSPASLEQKLPVEAQLSLELTGEISVDNSETVKSNTNSLSDSSKISGFTWKPGVLAWQRGQRRNGNDYSRTCHQKETLFPGRRGVATGCLLASSLQMMTI
ncbi:Abnormal Spindle-Like Microcephaly-Associated Protein [Manis pentadactyla]|nr:Abnormal Spindle-Like Microcephaly-Associated Protein [Manis pentadactyla]